MFADVIVDISSDAVDRVFEYRIPENLLSEIKRGTQVNIPFGKSNKLIKGFVTNIKDRAAWDETRLKYIDSIVPKSTNVEGSMIELADFIRKNYGGTMNQALKTVLPVKLKSAPVVDKYVCLSKNEEQIKMYIEKYAISRKYAARYRLITELERESILPFSIVKDRLGVSDSVVKGMAKDGLIQVESREVLREAIDVKASMGYSIVLNQAQKETVDGIWSRYKNGDTRTSLIRGVTGSGKTEIYIELISRMVKEGKQAIVLIPEISLTYQTVLRFYKKFGDRVSVINSRLTPAQKHDQIEKAKKGLVDVIIGPRSALFTPFNNLGIIIIDEEHEGTYRNENVPRYHSRDVAEKRADLCGGIVVLGSATPSIESYNKAEKGIYQLYTLENRAKGAKLPQVDIVDLRTELEDGNRCMTSRRLQELITDRLDKKEQIMLFINRRGHSSFVSCRKCGQAIMCPHCDVSLKYHKNGKLMCHYCGYETAMVKTCPECGSKYIGTFGTGTQKVEEEINRLFPQARTLRMDLDTTKEKDGHEKILSAFADGEADILIGTQMIVKGHDFANVTLVGIMAADLSLFSDNYQAAERTFQLITQAAGRAGRGSKEGNVVIQTYSPDNYAIKLGSKQDYTGFYQFEMDYRSILKYPPATNMLGIIITSTDTVKLTAICDKIKRLFDQKIQENDKAKEIWIMGPVDASISRINDRYRKIIYVKSEAYLNLVEIKDIAEGFMENNQDKEISITFDFSMIGGIDNGIKRDKG